MKKSKQLHLTCISFSCTNLIASGITCRACLSKKFNGEQYNREKSENKKKAITLKVLKSKLKI